MKLLVLLTFLTLCYSDDSLTPRYPVKRSYVCPPKFVRQGHRCYYFSKQPLTWQEAFYSCHERHSNLAVIRNANQDKLIRNVLNKKSLEPLERWLGGVYDWGKMAWKWAASGRPLGYNGFIKSDDKEYKESLRWHCIIMDPALEYKWNSRLCVEKKHYICHTKMKIVSNKDKKKLQRQYNADEYNKLNEVPVPRTPDYRNDTAPLKTNIPITYKFEINEHLNDQAQYGFVPAEKFQKATRNKKKQKRMNHPASFNGTITEKPRRKNKRKKKLRGEQERGVSASIRNMKWRTYKKQGHLINPLYPRPIVEEYSIKDR